MQVCESPMNRCNGKSTALHLAVCICVYRQRVLLQLHRYWRLNFNQSCLSACPREKYDTDADVAPRIRHKNTVMIRNLKRIDYFETSESWSDTRPPCGWVVCVYISQQRASCCNDIHSESGWSLMRNNLLWVRKIGKSVELCRIL